MGLRRAPYQVLVKVTKRTVGAMSLLFIGQQEERRMPTATSITTPKSLSEVSRQGSRHSDTKKKATHRRATLSFLKTLAVFVNDPQTRFSGADICRAAKLYSGAVYPLLDKMQENGWLDGEWEKIDPHKEGRPRRHLYHITRKGFVQGKKVLAEHLPEVKATKFITIAATL